MMEIVRNHGRRDISTPITNAVAGIIYKARSPCLAKCQASQRIVLIATFPNSLEMGQQYCCTHRKRQEATHGTA